jgi:hypothetical protein
MNTKELSEWVKNGQSREKVIDFLRKRKTILSLSSSKTSKNFHFHTLSNSKRTMKNLRKFLTALFNSVVTMKTENAFAN